MLGDNEIGQCESYFEKAYEDASVIRRAPFHDISPHTVCIVWKINVLSDAISGVFECFSICVASFEWMFQYALWKSNNDILSARCLHCFVHGRMEMVSTLKHSAFDPRTDTLPTICLTDSSAFDLFREKIKRIIWKKERCNTTNEQTQKETSHDCWQQIKALHGDYFAIVHNVKHPAPCMCMGLIKRVALLRIAVTTICNFMSTFVFDVWVQQTKLHKFLHIWKCGISSAKLGRL